jgi:hypothetical protein
MLDIAQTNHASGLLRLALHRIVVVNPLMALKVRDSPHLDLVLVQDLTAAARLRKAIQRQAEDTVKND